MNSKLPDEKFFTSEFLARLPKKTVELNSS